MYWMIAALVALFGVAILARTGRLRPSGERRRPRSAAPTRQRIEPLKPGETYDTPVWLATLPNVPLADMWCQRLREAGIDAFFKDGSPYVYGAGGLAILNQSLPAEVWIGEHDVDRARELFPELG